MWYSHANFTLLCQEVSRAHTKKNKHMNNNNNRNDKYRLLNLSIMIISKMVQVSIKLSWPIEESNYYFSNRLIMLKSSMIMMTLNQNVMNCILRKTVFCFMSDFLNSFLCFGWYFSRSISYPVKYELAHIFWFVYIWRDYFELTN